MILIGDFVFPSTESAAGKDVVLFQLGVDGVQQFIAAQGRRWIAVMGAIGPGCATSWLESISFVACKPAIVCSDNLFCSTGRCGDSETSAISDQYLLMSGTLFGE